LSQEEEGEVLVQTVVVVAGLAVYFIVLNT
jgi:hypothetical protein